MTHITRALDVSCVENIPDRVPNPVRRLNATKVVDYKNLDGKDRCKETAFCHFGLAAVTVLDLP